MEIPSFFATKPTGIAAREGRLLISTPFFNDPFFNHSVVLLTDHDSNGSAGLVINKPSKLTLEQLNLNVTVHLGGPVPAKQLFAIHNFGNCKNAHKLLPGIFVGYDAIFLSLIEHNAIETLRYKFFAGYSGWSAGQLEEEIEKGAWVVSNVTPELLFETPSDNIWKTAVKNLGPDYLGWLDIPVNLSNN
ncbi:MAG: YqgE/AlgH family protein [Bacteroidales bacterium]|nr:YqgE/AlgH family protein [Bacteroidales bacterium]